MLETSGRLLTRRALLAGLAVVGSGTLLQACTTLAPGQAVATPVPAKPTTQAAQPAATPIAASAPAPAATATSVPASAPSGAGQLANSVVFGSTGEPLTMNPLLDDTANSRNVWELIFEGLVRPDPRVGTATPWLAESWTTSPDGLAWQFKIRPNVKWSDGQPFTADDVKFTFQTMLDPKTKTPFRTRFDNVASFDAPNPATFEVTLKGPDCPFLVTTMLVGIIPKHLLESSPDINTDAFNSSRPVGTGPFMFKEWRRGEYLTLVANPNHWR